MRISDWSSDVCSSDLLGTARTREPLIVAEAEGVHIYNSDGQRMIDGIGGMWCVQVGYGRREMADAIAEQAMRMAYFSPFGLFSTRSEEHTSELQSLIRISYAVFCLKKTITK